MKQAMILSILAVLLTILLPVCRTAPAPAPSATPPPAPADRDITFTVLTDDGILATNMADFLPGVLAGEMPALFHTEALKAQAVAARTYILYRMEHPNPAHPQAVICNSPGCCKAYADDDTLRTAWAQSYDAYAAKITAAVTDTDGRYLDYNGGAIEAVFHSSSAGATEASAAIWNDRAYLVSVPSPETAEDVPNYVTTVDMTPSGLKLALRAAWPDMAFPDDPGTWLGAVTVNDSGRVETMNVCGKSLTGPQLRSALGLRSAHFTAEYTGTGFRFTVTGYGHGVGLSQYGANVYAGQGWDYAAILSHYYPGTQLTSAAG